MTTIICCAECGKDGGASLKACKSCMQVKYCDATCQRNHWATHKKQCKRRATELRDEALFKDLKTRPLRKTAPFAFYQYLVDFCRVCRFHPRLYCQYQFTTLRLQMRGWHVRIWKYIILVAERPFVEGASPPSLSRETLLVRFARRMQ